MLYSVILILAIIVAILLVLVVLAQPPKTGGGLSSAFGGGGSKQNVTGVKKGTDLIERITWGLAFVLLLLTLSSKFMVNRTIDDGLDSIKTTTGQDVKTSEDATPKTDAKPSTPSTETESK